MSLLSLYNVRMVTNNDYYKKHVNLYSQLTKIDPNQITYEMYTNFINSLHENHIIFVIEDSNEIIGTITIVIEQKLIHNMGKIAHIEDVIIDRRFRKLGAGRRLINYAIEYAKENNCYKIILDCNDDVSAFYEKCGFIKHGYLMSLYI